MPRTMSSIRQSRSRGRPSASILGRGDANIATVGITFFSATDALQAQASRHPHRSARTEEIGRFGRLYRLPPRRRHPAPRGRRGKHTRFGLSVPRASGPVAVPDWRRMLACCSRPSSSRSAPPRARPRRLSARPTAPRRRASHPAPRAPETGARGHVGSLVGSDRRRGQRHDQGPRSAVPRLRVDPG